MTDNGAAIAPMPSATPAANWESAICALNPIPQNQWQSRALHPNLFARVGLRRRLCQSSSEQPALILAAPLQLASPSFGAKLSPAHQQARPGGNNLLKLTASR